MDVACGTGRFACAVAGLVREMVCCDYSEKMVEQTKKKVRHLQLAHVSCTVQDIMDLQFEEARFDVVLAANVLHLLEHPSGAVKELERVAKFDGVLVFPTYITQQWKPISLLSLKCIQILGFKPAHIWSAEEFLQFLSTTDLELIDHTIIDSNRCLCIAVLKKKRGSNK